VAEENPEIHPVYEVLFGFGVPIGAALALAVAIATFAETVYRIGKAETWW